MHAQRIPIISFSSWMADSENGVMREPVLVFATYLWDLPILLQHFSPFPLFCATTTLVVPRIVL